MEGKNLSVSVVIMSLFIAQIQVDALICCPTEAARQTFSNCIPFSAGKGVDFCIKVSNCKFVTDDRCPEGYLNEILENKDDVSNKYCKLGCVFSRCGALTTLQKSDPSESMNGAIEKCVKACSNVCTKNSVNEVVTA